MRKSRSRFPCLAPAAPDPEIAVDSTWFCCEMSSRPHQPTQNNRLRLLAELHLRRAASITSIPFGSTSTTCPPNVVLRLEFVALVPCTHSTPPTTSEQSNSAMHSRPSTSQSVPRSPRFRIRSPRIFYRPVRRRRQALRHHNRNQIVRPPRPHIRRHPRKPSALHPDRPRLQPPSIDASVHTRSRSLQRCRRRTPHRLHHRRQLALALIIRNLTIPSPDHSQPGHAQPPQPATPPPRHSARRHSAHRSSTLPGPSTTPVKNLSASWLFIPLRSSLTRTRLPASPLSCATPVVSNDAIASCFHTSIPSLPPAPASEPSPQPSPASQLTLTAGTATSPPDLLLRRIRLRQQRHPSFGTSGSSHFIVSTHFELFTRSRIVATARSVLPMPA